MPTNKIFGGGFVGSATVGSAMWFAERADKMDIKSVIMPFTGSARNLSALAESDRAIDAWDIQMYSRCLVDGVFNASAIETVLDDKPRFTKGFMYSHRLIKNIDPLSAGFLDWVGANGTDADKAAIYTTTVKSTFRGRLDLWDSNIDEFWYKFKQTQKGFEAYTNLPGDNTCYEEDFYDSKTRWRSEYDLMLLDPPKIIGNTDIYSAAYNPLNHALHGTYELDRWSWKDYIGRLRNVLKGPNWKTLFFVYTSDVRPDFGTVKNLISEFATITDEATWPGRRRHDFTLVAERN